MQSVAIQLTVDRESGILKRGRGTPLPSWVFFAGRVGNALVISLLMLVIVPAIGRLLYGVAIPWDHLPAVLVTLAIGAASFCCLGDRADRGDPERGRRAGDHQRRSCCRSTSSPASSSPRPRSPTGSCTSPTCSRSATSSRPSSPPGTRRPPGAGFEWGNLAVVAAWGAVGLLLAIRFFRWTPRGG